MARYKFLQSYDVMKPEMLGGGLIKHFNAGDVIDGTFRVQQLEQWGAQNVNWVDTSINGQVLAIPATFLQQISASNSSPSTSEIPTPVKVIGGVLAGVALLFILPKLFK